jgi:UDPglucose--hexose-1-phosphate uridylyltransferase
MSSSSSAPQPASSPVTEFRRDPITGRWVIIAADRHDRPNEFEVEAARVVGQDGCPFCEGREDRTPPEVLAWRPERSAADSPGWTVRVVPNKFPAARAQAVLERVRDGVFEHLPAVGGHEVVVETPHHGETLATMTPEAVERVLWAWRERIRALKADPRVAYALVFKNHGALAGATIEHSHSQVIALPIVPEFVGSAMHGARTGHAGTGRCVFCDVIAQEAKSGVRVVEDAKGYLTLAPYASRFPFETWIIPRVHRARFEESTDGERRGLAVQLGRALRRIERGLDRPAFNLILHTAPFAEEAGPWYHWHVEIVPKLSRMGGFEWGTGFFINLRAPEDAAEVLRGVEV